MVRSSLPVLPWLLVLIFRSVWVQHTQTQTHTETQIRKKLWMGVATSRIFRGETTVCTNHRDVIDSVGL